MESNVEVQAGDGLRELARMIARDNVTGANILDYLRFLMEDRLIEPDALARRWARTVPKALGDSSPADLAAILRKMAKELDTAPRVE